MDGGAASVDDSAPAVCPAGLCPGRGCVQGNEGQLVSGE